jgi:hypothetical protein
VITGHIGIAAGVRSQSRAQMGSVLFLALLGAAVMPDAMDAFYWAINFCSPYGLYSHTLNAVVLEAAVVGGVMFLVTGSRAVALTFVLVVLLHSPADFFTGRKLFIPGGELLGLRFYDRPMLDLVFEIPFVVVGWWMLRRSGRGPRWAASVWALALVVATQATLDVFFIGPRGLKPNACSAVEARRSL